MPFSHAPVGGQGNLVVGQVQSPNFNAATGTGWRIAKDGSAQFYDVILPGGQGVSVFFAGTAPVTDHVGDLWYDTANGLALSRWSGTAWVAYQIGAGAIAANAGILGSQLAADAAIAAGQVSFTAQEIGGIRVTFGPAKPAGGNPDDLWFDTANGNQAYQYQEVTPAVPTAGLVAWYKADALGLANGDPVPNWPDSSGNGHEMGSGGATEAEYVTGVIGGMPVVRFSGTSWYTAPVSGLTAQPVSCYIVVSNPGGTRWANFGDGIRFGGGSQAMIYAGGSVNGPDVSGSAFCGFVVDGASSVVRVGGIDTDGNAGANGPGALVGVGSEGDNAQQYTGDVAEALFYDVALTDAELGQLDEYAQSRYGGGGPVYAWQPYQFGTGAIAPSAITAAQIEDLSVTVDKFKSADHYLY